MRDRQRRVGNEIRGVVAEMLTRGEIKDPRVGFVTISDVEMSPDLRRACIYFSMLGDEKTRNATLEGLTNAAGFVRRALAARLRLKFIPTVVFKFDGSFEYADKMTRLLNDIAEDEQ